MKILTWNINGIRSSKVPLKELFRQLNADVICLQETKVTRDQLDEASAIVEGFNSYFSFSKTKSGYSGVATFVKDSAVPVKAEEGLTGLLANQDGGTSSSTIGHYGNQAEFTDEELLALDSEGRTVITQHQLMNDSGEIKPVTIINVYCPRADPENEERKMFKLRFYQLLQTRAEAILKHSHVIILGDVNTSHRRIDNCDPHPDFDKNPCRKWLNQFLHDKDTPVATLPTSASTTESPTKSTCAGGKFVDTFRHLHPDQKEAYTCWSTVTGARATNYGVRIDYIFADMELSHIALTNCCIIPEVEGSDHCPVRATFSWALIPAAKCPSLCSKYLPEFTGKQQKLSAFFVKQKSKMSGDTSSDVTPSSSCSSTSLSEDGPKSENGVDSNAQRNATLKRQGSETLVKEKASKKPKLSQKSSSGSSRQGSLLSFFSKKSSNTTSTTTGNEDYSCGKDSGANVTSMEARVTSITSDTTGVTGDAGVTGDVSDTSTTGINGTSLRQSGSQPISTQMISDMALEQPKVESSEPKLDAKPNGEKKSLSSGWKTLLKGPAPPPACKGHKEPCVLRTVKKDSLNKGRQFYVCNRPEGAKSNPEARCDHFEWVVKKKKVPTATLR